MSTRLLARISCLVVTVVLTACSSKDDKPEPLRDIVGRWDRESYVFTSYDEAGNVAHVTEMPAGPGDYYVFHVDKSFEEHYDLFSGVTPGTYTYTNTLLTTSVQQGTQQATLSRRITTFTNSRLVLTHGEQKKGTRSAVDVLTLIKH